MSDTQPEPAASTGDGGGGALAPYQPGDWRQARAFLTCQEACMRAGLAESMGRNVERLEAMAADTKLSSRSRQRAMAVASAIMRHVAPKPDRPPPALPTVNIDARKVTVESVTVNTPNDADLRDAYRILAESGFDPFGVHTSAPAANAVHPVPTNGKANGVSAPPHP